jgi:uncharacterized protein
MAFATRISSRAALRVDGMSIVDFVNPLYSLSGFGVGLLVGLTGVGGGSLMTPVLILLFGIHPATAVGSDLLYASITKSGGAVVHGRNKTIDWRLTVRLAMGSVPAATLTLFLLNYLGLSGEAASRLISVALGVAIILTALALVFRKSLAVFASGRGEMSDARTAALTIVTGVVLGILVSLSSVGAGAIGMTALVILYPRLPTVTLVGSDIAHAVPLTLVAGIGHWILGTVNWLLIGSLLVGSLPGIVIGSQLSAYLPDRILRPILATILLFVGYRILAV